MSEKNNKIEISNNNNTSNTTLSYGDTKGGNESEWGDASLNFEEASTVMKFLASAVPSENFKNSIRNKLNTDKNSDLSDIFDLEGNIKIKAFGEMSETAKTFLNGSNEGKKILRAINVLKTIFLALSNESVKFGSNGLGKNLLSILKGWGVENKPNDKTVIEVSKILASIKSMGGSKLIGDEFKSPGKDSKDYERMVKEYNITEKQLESDNNFMADFINKNKSLGNLLCKKLNFIEDQKLQMLKNATLDQSLSKETLNEIVGLFTTIDSNLKIGDGVKNEIFSKSKELDEKTTSKVPLLNILYNALLSSYSDSAKTLQKIVDGYGDITFNVFLINDEEFKVAMKTFEEIYQNNNDAGFGSLLKTIKILRICANQTDNQTAKKFKNYAEEHKQTAISTLFSSSDFLSNFIPGDELEDSANSNILEANFDTARLFFSKFELSKEDIEDIEKCVLESGAIIRNNEIFYDEEKSEEKNESEGIANIMENEARIDGIDEYKNLVIKPDSDNKNMAIIEIPGSLGKIELNVSLTKTLDYQSIVSFDQKEFKERKLQVLQLISEKMIGPHNLLEGTTGLEISKIANGFENKLQEQTARQILDEYANIIILPSLFNQYSPKIKISSIRNLTFYPSDEFKKNPLFNSIVKQFSQSTPMLNQLSKLIAENSIIMEINTEERKNIGAKKMLENATLDQSLSKDTLDEIVGLFTTIGSNPKIGDVVRNEILSRSEELDEKTTSKVPLLGRIYNTFFSSYSDSAKTLQKIVDGYGDITFDVFLIDDKEFEVAMDALENIPQNKNDVAFGNLLKIIKILRICVNQKENQMAKEFKGYAEERKQTAISDLLINGYFFSGSDNTRQFFSKCEFSKEEIDDVNKLVSPEEEKAEEKKENEEKDKEKPKIEEENKEENKEINEKKEVEVKEKKEREVSEEKANEYKDKNDKADHQNDGIDELIMSKPCMFNRKKKSKRPVLFLEEEEQINDKKEKSDEKKATITKNEEKDKEKEAENENDNNEENKEDEKTNKSMDYIRDDIYKSSSKLKRTIESATSTNNTTRIDDSNLQLIGEQLQEKQTEESHILRRIGVILLGFVISVLFIATVTFALAAIPGVGPVIGGILGKAFVDAATLSIGSGVLLGWVAGGIGALFTFTGGVFFGKNIKTLWTPKPLEEPKGNNNKNVITMEDKKEKSKEQNQEQNQNEEKIIKGNCLDINDKKPKELPNPKIKSSLFEKIDKTAISKIYDDDFSVKMKNMNRPLKLKLEDEKNKKSQKNQNEIG